MRCRFGMARPKPSQRNDSRFHSHNLVLHDQCDEPSILKNHPPATTAGPKNATICRGSGSDGNCSIALAVRPRPSKATITTTVHPTSPAIKPTRSDRNTRINRKRGGRSCGKGALPSSSLTTVDRHHGAASSCGRAESALRRTKGTCRGNA